MSYKFNEYSHFYIDTLTKELGQVQDDGSFLLAEIDENQEEDIMQNNLWDDFILQ